METCKINSSSITGLDCVTKQGTVLSNRSKITAVLRNVGGTKIEIEQTCPLNSSPFESLNECDAGISKGVSLDGGSGLGFGNGIHRDMSASSSSCCRSPNETDAALEFLHIGRRDSLGRQGLKRTVNSLNSTALCNGTFGGDYKSSGKKQPGDANGVYEKAAAGKLLRKAELGVGVLEGKRPARGSSTRADKGARLKTLPKDVRVESIDQFLKTKFCPYMNKPEGCMRHRSNVCPYAHSDFELRPMPNLNKTAMCRLFLKGMCPKSADECGFAHNLQDLRCTHGFFKTEICRFWKQGHCRAGNTCRHAHGEEELRSKYLKNDPFPKQTGTDVCALPIASSLSSISCYSAFATVTSSQEPTLAQDFEKAEHFLLKSEHKAIPAKKCLSSPANRLSNVGPSSPCAPTEIAIVPSHITKSVDFLSSPSNTVTSASFLSLRCDDVIVDSAFHHSKNCVVDDDVENPLSTASLLEAETKPTTSLSVSSCVFSGSQRREVSENSRCSRGRPPVVILPLQLKEKGDKGKVSDIHMYDFMVPQSTGELEELDPIKIPRCEESQPSSDSALGHSHDEVLFELSCDDGSRVQRQKDILLEQITENSGASTLSKNSCESETSLRPFPKDVEKGSVANLSLIQTPVASQKQNTNKGFLGLRTVDDGSKEWNGSQTILQPSATCVREFSLSLPALDEVSTSSFSSPSSLHDFPEHKITDCNQPCERQLQHHNPRSLHWQPILNDPLQSVTLPSPLGSLDIAASTAALGALNLRNCLSLPQVSNLHAGSPQFYGVHHQIPASHLCQEYEWPPVGNMLPIPTAFYPTCFDYSTYATPWNVLGDGRLVDPSFRYPTKSSVQLVNGDRMPVHRANSMCTHSCENTTNSSVGEPAPLSPGAESAQVVCDATPLVCETLRLCHEDIQAMEAHLGQWHQVLLDRTGDSGSPFSVSETFAQQPDESSSVSIAPTIPFVPFTPPLPVCTDLTNGWCPEGYLLNPEVFHGVAPSATAFVQQAPDRQAKDDAFCSYSASVPETLSVPFYARETNTSAGVAEVLREPEAGKLVSGDCQEFCSMKIPQNGSFRKMELPFVCPSVVTSPKIWNPTGHDNESTTSERPFGSLFSLEGNPFVSSVSDNPVVMSIDGCAISSNNHHRIFDESIKFSEHEADRRHNDISTDLDSEKKLKYKRGECSYAPYHRYTIQQLHYHRPSRSSAGSTNTGGPRSCSPSISPDRGMRASSSATSLCTSSNESPFADDDSQEEDVKERAIEVESSTGENAVHGLTPTEKYFFPSLRNERSGARAGSSCGSMCVTCGREKLPIVQMLRLMKPAAEGKLNGSLQILILNAQQVLSKSIKSAEKHTE